MNSVLEGITDWPARARKARFNEARLAKACGVSARQFYRFIKWKFDRKPHQWLCELRQADAWLLLMQGRSVKEAASSIGYASACHLSRDFKRIYGVSPGRVRLAVIRVLNVAPP